MALPKPVFVSVSPDAVVAELIAFLEAATGKTLHPAQTERMLVNSFAYRIVLLLAQIDQAALMNLVAFSVGINLDYLGGLVGVTRLPEQPAQVTVNFEFIATHGVVQIPAGTRVTTGDGLVQFATIDAVTALAIDTDVDVLCEAVVPGEAGNGYIAGTITTIIDPLSFVSSVASVDTSAGGHDQESDDQLRDRITLAPESFSVAGPAGAYEFHAKSADPSIVDVAVIQSVPGTVEIYPLTETIPTPSPILAAVALICSAEKIRPLSDTVNVLTPIAQNYSLNVDLTLYDGADAVFVVQQVTDALTTFAAERRAAMGKDVKRVHVNREAALPGQVYDLLVNQPAADLIVAENEVANCTGITVNVIGYNNG